MGFSIGPVVGALISFITIPLTTYFVSPEEFGKASMFTLFQGLLGILLCLGLDQAYTREYHESESKTNLLKNAMLIPLLVSLLFFFMICINLNTVSSLLFGSPNFHYAAMLFGVTIIFLVIERFIMLSIRMEERALEYSLLNIILKLSVLIFTILFVLLIRRDFLAVVYSTVLGQMIADVYLVIRYRKYLDYRSFSIDKKLLITLIKFGAPLIIAASLTRLLNSLDRIAMRAWSDFYEIGIFTAALRISATLAIVQTSFSIFWTPTAYRWYKEDKDIKHFDLVSNTVLLVLSLLFFIIILFKDVIVLLLGSEYEDTKFIIGFLCLYPIMYTLSETTTLGIVFTRKSYYNIWVSLLAIFPNIILNFALIPKYGAVGAAIATGVSYLVFFLARSYFSNKNWIGFSLKPHIKLTFILFLVAGINTLSLEYINIINLLLLLVIIIIQLPTIKKIILIYTKKDAQEWDFS